MKRRIGILIALYLLNILSSQVFSQAPPPNPVFVNDSAEAARLLARAQDLTTTNPAETVRLIQIVLDEHQDMLVPDPQENGRFESARSVALGILLTDDALLKRYDRAESRRAREMLEEGRLRGLVETRSATRAGLEALLLLAQQNLEAGRLAIADSWLEEALAHHLMTDEDRWAAWLMRGMASHGRGHQTAVEDMTRRLEEAGPEAEPWYEAMMAWTSRNPPSPLQSRDMLDATDQSVGDLLEPSLWNAAYARTPVSILSNSEFSEELIEANTLSGRLTAIVPAIVDDRIYFNEGAEVARVNLFTGLEDWRTSILDPSNRTDRINDPIGPTTVAVDGDDLVTWIGYSMAGGTSESKEVVCLDTRTGDERWRFNLADTKGVDDPQSLYPAGPVVIHEDRVFVIARRERRQGLKSCYLLALNRLDGTPAFATYIASTGSQFREGSLRPLTMPVVKDDQIIIATSIGAIASVDVASGRVQWLQRLDTPVAGTQATTRIRPYDIHVPLVIDNSIISLSPDYRQVVVMDADHGRRQHMMLIDDRPEWKSVNYMLTDGRRVFVVGSSISAMDPDDLSVPLWTTWPQSKGQGRALAGRIHLADDRLYVPTGADIVEINTANGDILRRMPITGSSLPLAIEGHLLVGDARGLTLHAERSRIRTELEDRLDVEPDDPGTHLSLIRVAARTGDRSMLLDRITVVMPLLNNQDMVDEATAQFIRERILQEIRTNLDPAESVSRSEYLAVRTLLDTFTQDTSLEASAQLMLGDWMAASDLEVAVSHWQQLIDDPVLADSMHIEDSIVAPASAWASRRLADASRRYPELVAPPAWKPLDPTTIPWEARMAAMAGNLRTQRDTERLAKETARMLEESIRERRAAHGLALLDLWIHTHGDSSSLLEGHSTDAWRDRLVNEAFPVIPRHEATGGQSRQWSGRLVSNVSNDRSPLHMEDAFLRSHEDRLTWHEGPEYAPSWTTYLAHREASIIHQDDLTVIIQIAQLGKPSQLASLSRKDGEILWTLDLPGDLFAPVETAKQIEEEAEFETLTSSGWIAIEPVGDRILLLHQDGRSTAISTDQDTSVLWQSALPGHVIRDWTAWQNGVVVIGYSHDAAANDWLDDELAPGDVILAWFDAATGDVKSTEIPKQLGIPLWLRSNSLGDLIVGGSNGVALYREPGRLPEWMSLDRSLQAMRIREGVVLTPQALLVTDLQYDMHAIALESGQKIEPMDSPLSDPRTGMPRLHASGDRVWMLYDKELQILDSRGRQLGSDAISRTQHHTFEVMAPFADGLIVVDQMSSHSGRRRAAQMAGPSRPYRLQIMKPGGRSVETIDLFDLNSRIRAARAVDGVMLLTTDEEVLAVQLPPDLDESNP